jgi:integrin beta 3
MFDAELFGDEMATMVRDFVERATAPLIEANAGLASQCEALTARVAELEARQPEKGEPGEPGTAAEVDMDAVRALVDEAARSVVAERLPEAIAALPPPQRGEKGDPGEKGEKGEPGHPGRDGADGVGLANSLIDRDGNLVVTMTNGDAKALGLVVGRDGKDGERGPAGFSLEMFGAEQIDERIIRFTLGTEGEEAVCEFKLPVMIYRDIWNAERTYDEGDAVTWGGSLWVAQKDTPEGKPDAPDSGWKLCVKRGRDGKDAK